MKNEDGLASSCRKTASGIFHFAFCISCLHFFAEQLP
jgi:hypothetical protein